MYRVSRVNHVVPIRSFFGLSGAKGGSQCYKITRKVSTPPDILYQVIADVSKYDDFVPFVTSSFVNKLDQKTKLPTEAGFRVGWKQYDENFTCKLVCSENKIVAESISISLFENLRNEWHLREVKSRFTKESSTLVEVVLKYKFRNPLYNTLSSLFHEQVSNIIIKAFESRAMDIKIQRKLGDRMNTGTID
ncbi:hypothetical protein JCM33374_g185 [Metschnikowia sp. JCM 33374]|nr:hypothetical protein JCM33374_g185 [Metschnikowia sp. JCM 33374]